MPGKRKRSPPVASPKKSTARKDVDEEVSFKKSDEEVIFKSQMEEDEVTFKPKKVEEEAPSEPRRSPNGFILPDPLPRDHILTDNRKKKWQIGESIGLGGFGEIYAAKESGSGPKMNYVIKVEPHTNGPLFVEISFYIRAAKKEQLEAFKAEKGLNHLGLAHFVASGSLVFKGKKLRFLVLPRYGMDLQSVMDSVSGFNFSPERACSQALQVVDSLEYIHSKGYVHKDVKGSNLLLGAKGQVFLVDFGLCASYISPSGVHKPNVPDKRWAHEGTLEYTSRDTHLGTTSRRGDIEVLLYNLVEWMGGVLPWDTLGEDPTVRPHAFHTLKIGAFQDPHKFLRECFKKHASNPDDESEVCYPNLMLNLMEFIDNTPFHEAPDYQRLRVLFVTEMYKSKAAPEEEVTLNIEMTTPQKKKLINLALNPPKSPSSTSHEKENLSPNVKKMIVKSRKSPGKKRGKSKEQKNAAAVYKDAKDEAFKVHAAKSLENPTEAMLKRMAAMKRRSHSLGPNARGKSTTPNSTPTKGKSPSKKDVRKVSVPTDAMLEVMEISKRLRLAEQSEEQEEVSKRLRSTTKRKSSSTTPEKKPTASARKRQRAQVRNKGSLPFTSAQKRKLNFGTGKNNVTQNGDNYKEAEDDDPEISFAAPPNAKKRKITPFFKDKCFVSLERHENLAALSKSGSESPSLSRQVSQVVEVGLDNLSGFFAGVSRTLLNPFSRKK